MTKKNHKNWFLTGKTMDDKTYTPFSKWPITFIFHKDSFNINRVISI